MSRAGDLDDRFAELKREYAADVPAKVAEIAAAVDEAAASGAPEPLARATDMAHRLAGTAGAYGFPKVGERAGALQDALRAVADAGWPAVRAAVAELSATLRR